MDTREAPVSVEQVASEGIVRRTLVFARRPPFDAQTEHTRHFRCDPIEPKNQRALRHEASRALQQENRLLWGGTEET